MKRFGKWFLLLAAILMVAGPALADEHVKVAPNGKGDVLIFPMYVAFPNGYNTRVTIVNTSETYSTVVKVVVRSYLASQELLDFLVFLSPADMWVGYLMFDEDLGPVLYSTDDSALTADGTWASPDNPIYQPLVATTTEGDTNQIGYLYAINVVSDVQKTLGRAPGVAKSAIKTWYAGFNDECPNNLVWGQLDVEDCDTVTVDEGDVYKPLNILAGWVEMNWTGYNVAGVRATTLKDYENQVYVAGGLTTWLGVGAKNNLADVEAALAKNWIAMPYINTEYGLTWGLFTFPTKYAYDFASGYSGPFWVKYKDDGTKYLLECVTTSRKVFDTAENSSSPVFSPPPPAEGLCYELSFVDSSNFPFKEGWVRYAFSYANTYTETSNYPTTFPMEACLWEDNNNYPPYNTSPTYTMVRLTYYGVPTIPTLLDTTLGVLTDWRYAAWSDGEVELTLSTGETTSGYVFDPADEDNINYHYSDVRVDDYVTPAP